ncbi:anticodon nuclease [Mannheimia haemolytica]|uniref:anticodon nuclease n=1 Tax=Mannheimia haemolytica TaxID=75985 RepID=UPI002EA12999|nr:anticodon nuclease [Mannheimia haemolytica]
MSKDLTEIATMLRDKQQDVQLIYAFNGTGKTRLSRAFKELVSPKNNSGLARNDILYYNAFTEDLFYWDNDLKEDSQPKLKIQPNSFTNWVLKEQAQDQNIITHFQRYTNDKLTPKFSEDFNEVTFSFARGNDDIEENIKISKGEESNFVWSVFYSLLKSVIEELKMDENDRSTQDFNKLQYIFIDDPVSSLDENHLIQLAIDLADLTKSISGLKFVISTHNTLFYKVLYNELGLRKGYFLKKYDDGSFELDEKQGGSNKAFSYHLFLKKTIEEAIKNGEIQKYHFTLLRNLYEKTANFLGYAKWSELLPDEKELYTRQINRFSHSTLTDDEVAEPTEAEKNIVVYLLNHLIDNYSYWKDVSNES